MKEGGATVFVIKDDIQVLVFETNRDALTVRLLYFVRGILTVFSYAGTLNVISMFVSSPALILTGCLTGRNPRSAASTEYEPG